MKKSLPLLALGAVAAGFAFFQFFVGEGAHEFWRASIFVGKGGEGELPVWVELAPLTVTIIVENFTGAIGTVIFVAYMSSLCQSPLHTATQYALLTALAAIGRENALAADLANAPEVASPSMHDSLIDD